MDVIEYRIDAGDRIVAVSRDFEPFARSNGAPELTAGRCLGRTLWEFIAGDEPRVIWRQLLRRCRDGGERVQMPLRCDGTCVRRELEASLAPLPEDGIDFRFRTVSVVPCDYRAILDRDVGRSAGALSSCSWCRAVQIADDEWLPVDLVADRLGLHEASRLPRLSHGVCPDCRQQLLTEVLSA